MKRGKNKNLVTVGFIGVFILSFVFLVFFFSSFNSSSKITGNAIHCLALSKFCVFNSDCCSGSCAGFQCQCARATCSSLGKTCGGTSDGCGRTLNCGSCPSGKICSSGSCITPPCAPSTCSSLGKTCGSVSNGCGGTLNCGTCASGKTCTNGLCVSVSNPPSSPVSNFSSVVPSEKISNSTAFNGYIVQLTDSPLIVQQQQAPTASRNVVSQRTVSLKNSHDTFKQQALTTLGKSSIATGNVVSNQNDLQVLGEYSEVFNGLALNITPADAEKIRTLSGVKAVYPNYMLYPTDIGFGDPLPQIGADYVQKLDADGNNCASSGKQCITGKGIRIGIIDSGVDYTHPDLGGCFGTGCKVVGGWDFSSWFGLGDSDPMDDDGHGTHVASIAASVAPDASIYAYKISFDLPEGTYVSFDSWVISAIERSVDPNQDGDISDHLDVISLSLDGTGNPDDAMSQAIDNAVSAGVVVVAAAGNSGPNASTIGSPGDARSAITVGAGYGLGYVPYWTSRGPVVWNGNTIDKPDIIAPGAVICGAQASQDKNWQLNKENGIDIHCKDNKHITMSGTSMATPFVSGAVALIKQAHPDWTPEQIKNSLKNNAEAMGYCSDKNTCYAISTNVDIVGAGAINISKAIAIGIPLPACKTNGMTCSITSDCCTGMNCGTSHTCVPNGALTSSCYSLNHGCTFANYAQSNCCTSMRCIPVVGSSTFSGYCTSCKAKGIRPRASSTGSDQINLCCNGHMSWVWDWLNSGYYCD